MLASAEQNITNGRRWAFRLMIYALFSIYDDVLNWRNLFFPVGLQGLPTRCHQLMSYLFIGCLRASVIRRDVAALLLQRLPYFQAPEIVWSNSAHKPHIQTKTLFGKLQNLLSSNRFNSWEAAQIKILRYESLHVQHQWALVSGESEIAAADGADF